MATAAPTVKTGLMVHYVPRDVRPGKDVCTPALVLEVLKNEVEGDAVVGRDLEHYEALKLKVQDPEYVTNASAQGVMGVREHSEDRLLGTWHFLENCTR